VVTLDWLKDCFLQESRITELNYYPKEAKVDGSNHAEQTQSRKQRKSYTVTKNIFMGGTFAIKAESFS
jgi:hypothetical protein